MLWLSKYCLVSNALYPISLSRSGEILLLQDNGLCWWQLCSYHYWSCWSCNQGLCDACFDVTERTLWDLQGKELNWFVYIFILKLLKKDKKVKQMPVRAEVGPFHSTFILSEYSGHVSNSWRSWRQFFLLLFYFLILFTFILSEYSGDVWWIIAGGRGDNFFYFFLILFSIHFFSQWIFWPCLVSNSWRSWRQRTIIYNCHPRYDTCGSE